MSTRRPNPRVALERILNAADHDDALARMTELLRRAWAAGHDAGWGDGVSDAVDDEPEVTTNPYAPRT